MGKISSNNKNNMSTYIKDNIHPPKLITVSICNKKHNKIAGSYCKNMSKSKKSNNIR